MKVKCLQFPHWHLFKKSLILSVMLCFSFTFLKAQDRSISGKITTKKDEPIVGAAIQVKGTNTGTTTNAEGNYQLLIPVGKDELIVSMLGFKQRTIKISDNNTLNITLEESTLQLGEGIVVTATRTQSKIDDIPQKIQIIDHTTIERTASYDLSDVLKKNAAVDVIQYPGLLSGVGIRGFRPQFSGVNQRTLTLIDGRPAGATNLALIDMNNVERIEVLKGPASALYGSRAMGGVINIITKKTQGDINGQISLMGGSFDTYEAGLAFGGDITNNLDFDVSFNSFARGKDYRVGNNSLFRDAFGWDKADRVIENDDSQEIDDARFDDGTYPATSFSKYSGSVRLGYQIHEDWRADIRAERFFGDKINTTSDIEYIIGGFGTPNVKDVDRYSTDISITGQISDNNQLIAKAYHAIENTINYRTSSVPNSAALSRYKSGDNEIKWQGGQLQDILQLNQHSLTLGVDYEHITQDNTSYSSTGEANPVSVRRPNFTLGNLGLYAQGSLNFMEERLNTTLGLRYENIRYEVTGTENFPERDQTLNSFNPSLGLNFKVTDAIRLHGTFGTGFTAVSVFQVAGYDERAVTDQDGFVDVWQGNADLENPKSTTFDAGISFNDEKRGFNADITYFNTTFENNVVAQNQTDVNIPAPSGSGNTVRNLNTYTNAPSTTLSGLEVSLSYDLGAKNNYKNSIRFFANSTIILEAEEIRDVYLKGETTLEMHNVADLTLNYGIEYDNYSWFTTRLSGRYVGRRYDTDWSYYLGGASVNPDGNYADIKYPSFMVLDYTATFKIAGQHQVGIRIDNITDENYYEKRGFNMPGRTFYLKYILSL